MNRVRIQGDLTRYWIVDDVPVIEKITVAYQPDDPRSEPIPIEVHNLYLPQLVVLMQEEADILTVVDGDGNPITVQPEAVVNGWLVEVRTVDYLPGPPFVDPIFAVGDETPLFTRVPLPGAAQVTIEQHADQVALVEQNRLTDLKAFYITQVAEQNANRTVITEPVAQILLGDPITVETLMAQAAGG